MMDIFAIDPGTTESGWIYISDGVIKTFGIDENHAVIEHLKKLPADYNVVIEMIQHFGMPAGASLFETCVWIGRYEQAWMGRGSCHKLFRKEVKMHLCGSMKAKDGNIRAALIDRYGPGKERAIGLKKSPGPLYGVSSDVWAALAVAVTYWDKRKLPF